MATSKVFFDDIENKIVKADLFSDIAKQETEKFLKFYPDNRGKKRAERGTPSSTQIRKFFNDILVIKQKIDIGLDNQEKEKIFRKELPYIKMIKAKVAYAKSRGNINKEFETFLNKYIDNIKDIDDFFIFCDFFEAIIAYSKLIYK